MSSRIAPPAPGSICQGYRGHEHLLRTPSDDPELQQAFAWLRARPIAVLFDVAVQSAIEYVLDGRRTGRFDLMDPRVDSDERCSVSTKLQYHLLEALELPKRRSPDTLIDRVPVDIKGTVRDNWSIPREAQCEICLLIKVDAARDRHRAWLMRTHRAWLYGGKGNGDQKRGIMVDALDRFALPLYDWRALPASPLKLLNSVGLDRVFEDGVGQERRLTELFRRLPGTVIPRQTIETVGFGNDDPLRRARATKGPLRQLGLELLCGKWTAELDEAARLGFDLSGNAWVAVPRSA